MIKQKTKNAIIYYLILILFIILFYFILNTHHLNYKNNLNNYKIQVVYVSKNDTLTSLSNFCQNGKNNLNNQDIINIIKKLNNFKNSNLKIGQKLIVPIY